MAIPFIGGLIKQGMDLIDSIGDKIAPDKNVQLKTEADIEKFTQQLKADFKLSVMDKMLQKGTAENNAILEDVKGARDHEIELAKMEPPPVRYVTGLLRGIFRPVIGFATIGSYVWSQFLAPYWDFPQLVLSPYAHGFVGIVVTFYFGGRTMEKIKNPQGVASPLVQTVKFATPQAGIPVTN